MARLGPREITEAIERCVAQRPWVRPLAGIAAPDALVAFVRGQLGDVAVHDDEWIASARPAGIAVTGTRRLASTGPP